MRIRIVPDLLGFVNGVNSGDYTHVTEDLKIPYGVIANLSPRSGDLPVLELETALEMFWNQLCSTCPRSVCERWVSWRYKGCLGANRRW
jgi:hypothetical protein